MGHAHGILLDSIEENTKSLSESDLPSHCRQHLKALRVQKGEKVNFLNGAGLVAQFQCTQDKPYAFEFLSSERKSQRRPRIALALSIVKRDALSQALSQATEVGIDQVYLLRAQNSDTPKKQEKSLVEKAQKIVRAACEQSQSPFLPEIDSQILSPADLLKKLLQENRAVVFADENLAGKAPLGIQTKLKNSSFEEKVLFIGPEGGWSKEELEAFSQSENIEALCLGEQILKVPTACVLGLYELHREIAEEDS